MKMFLFNMEILDEKEGTYLIAISIDDIITMIEFTPDKKLLKFCQKDKVSDILKRNEHQFRKVLHIKKPETYYKGFKLDFALRDEKDVIAFNDISKILVVDKRKDQYKNYVTEKEKKGIYELYIDGSYMEKRKKGGYAIVTKDPKEKYNLYTFETDEQSSSLIELLAAIKGLEILKNIKNIRIITDSQYVRKGLTEWIVNWKLNNWHTANGDKVKNIECWKKFDVLTDNKYIEFKYVKAHSQHFENTMADLYAKDMAKK